MHMNFQRKNIQLYYKIHIALVHKNIPIVIHHKNNFILIRLYFFLKTPSVDGLRMIILNFSPHRCYEDKYN